VAVSRDTTADLKRFLSNNAIRGFEVVRLRGETRFAWAGELVPVTAVVAPDGRVVSVQRGAADWSDPSVLSFVDKLASGAHQPTPGS